MRFLVYPDTGLGAAWTNLDQGKQAEPLHRSDFSACADCKTCAGYGKGPQTTLTAETLMASLREIIAAFMIRRMAHKTEAIIRADEGAATL